ncbi:MAG TPA: Hsp70 family protein, partial [Archangium sp.]
ASRVEGFATLGPEQSMVRIEVYQGEHAMVSSNTRLGELLVERLPTGRINHFDVRFTYDLNGILEVEVSLESGEKKVLVINRTGDALGASDLEAMRERFKALKIHPRETLPNRSALEMGETLYAQLLGEEREVLASLLAAFRIELNRGRRGDIEGARVVLLEFIRAQKGARTLLH